MIIDVFQYEGPNIKCENIRVQMSKILSFKKYMKTELIEIFSKCKNWMSLFFETDSYNNGIHCDSIYICVSLYKKYYPNLHFREGRLFGRNFLEIYKANPNFILSSNENFEVKSSDEEAYIQAVKVKYAHLN